MDEPARVVTSEDLHATYLDRSRKELQRTTEQLKRALAKENEKLAAVARAHRGKDASRSTPQPGTKVQLDAVAEAYREAAASEPFLPFPDSVVPALVALRATSTTINESRRFLARQKVTLAEAQERMETEKAGLADQDALTTALRNRMQSLKGGMETRKAMTPGQMAQQKMSHLRQQIQETDTDTTKLQKTLKKFIDESLAAMLAAEEMGGPVAGDMMDVDSDTLDAGFTATGKRKKARADASPGKRQRRIDDMDMFGGGGGGGGGGGSGDGGVEAESDKRAAARDDMQELVAELTHRLMAAGGSGTDAYMHIPEETASVRFLTRVKVAEFHPRDSKRLRLVDFGREIGD